MGSRSSGSFPLIFIKCTSLVGAGRISVCWGSGQAVCQDGPQWHIDFSELKLLKKQPVLEKQSDLPLSPDSRKYVFHVKGNLFVPGSIETSLKSEV